MPARDQQHEIGKGEPISQARCQRMARQVVDADQGQPGPGGDTFGKLDPRHDSADQPRQVLRILPTDPKKVPPRRETCHRRSG